MAEPVAGICVIRDQRDLLFCLCGHYLRLGFTHLVFVDDGSSDGTYAFLRRLSRCDRRVSVRRVERPRFEQPALMDEMANELIAAGCRIVFPFDSDEFWNVELASVRKAAEGVDAGLFIGTWVPFVQSRRARRPRPFGFLSVRYSAPVAATSKVTAVELGAPPFAVGKRNVAFKSDQPVAVGPGQHRLIEGPKRVLTDSLEVFHLQVPHAETIAKRVARAPRNEGLGVRLRDEKLTYEDFHRIVGDWDLNSADRDGCIAGKDGSVFVLRRDGRLRALMLKGWLYLALRHPLLLLAR